jgi:hypothetical protein
LLKDVVGGITVNFSKILFILLWGSELFFSSFGLNVCHWKTFQKIDRGVFQEKKIQFKIHSIFKNKLQFRFIKNFLSKINILEKN